MILQLKQQTDAYKPLAAIFFPRSGRIFFFMNRYQSDRRGTFQSRRFSKGNLPAPGVNARHHTPLGCQLLAQRLELHPRGATARNNIAPRRLLSPRLVPKIICPPTATQVLMSAAKTSSLSLLKAADSRRRLVPRTPPHTLDTLSSFGARAQRTRHPCRASFAAIHVR